MQKAMLGHSPQSPYLREHVDASESVHDMGAPKWVSLWSPCASMQMLLQICSTLRRRHAFLQANLYSAFSDQIRASIQDKHIAQMKLEENQQFL